MDEKPIPWWQRIAAATYLIAWGLIVGFYHGRFVADFYPPDASRIAPNLIASAIIISSATILGVLIWPPTRRAIHRAFDKKMAPIHDHLKAIRAHHEAHAKSLKALHEKLDALQPPPAKVPAAKRKTPTKRPS